MLSVNDHEKLMEIEIVIAGIYFFKKGPPPSSPLGRDVFSQFDKTKVKLVNYAQKLNFSHPRLFKKKNRYGIYYLQKLLFELV